MAIYPSSLLSLLYNVAYNGGEDNDPAGLKYRFHKNPDVVAKDDFNLEDKLVRAIIAWGSAREKGKDERQAATNTLMQVLGDEILAGDATAKPYKIW